MRLLRRVRALSFHFGLSPGFDLCLFVISCFYFSCFYFSMLLLLFFRSLVRLASLSSLFFAPWARVAVFAWTVLRGGLAALCLVSQLSVWSRGALPRRLGQRRCECNSNSFQGESSIPAPTSTASPRSRHRGTLCLPVINLAPRGEGGMVASAKEAESSASSASSDRPSAVLPIVSLPRGLLAWVS